MRDDFLTPVTRTTLTGDICRKMVSHLIRGDWREADRIPPERELCQKLGGRLTAGVVLADEEPVQARCS